MGRIAAEGGPEKDGTEGAKRAVPDRDDLRGGRKLLQNENERERVLKNRMITRMKQKIA